MKIYFKSFFILFLYSNISIAATCKDVFKKIPTEPTTELLKVNTKEPTTELLKVNTKEPTTELLKVNTKEHTAKVLEDFLEQAYTILKNLNTKDLSKEVKSYTPEQNDALGKFFFNKDSVDIQNIQSGKLLFHASNTEKASIHEGNIDKASIYASNTEKASIFFKQAFNQGNYLGLDWMILNLGKILKKVNPKTFFKDLSKEELLKIAEDNTAHPNATLELQLFSDSKKSDYDFTLLKQAAEKENNLYAMKKLFSIYKHGTEAIEPNLEEARKWKQKHKETFEKLSSEDINDPLSLEFELDEYKLQISQEEINNTKAVEAFLLQTILALKDLNLNKEELLEEMEFYTLEQIEELSWSFYPVNKDYALTLFKETLILSKQVSKKYNPYVMYWLADIYSTGTETMKPNLKKSEKWLAELNKNLPKNLEAFALKVYLAKIAREKFHPTETISKTIFKQTFLNTEKLNEEVIPKTIFEKVFLNPANLTQEELANRQIDLIFQSKKL